MRNIYTRYHICQMRIKSRRVSLERWFDVKYLSCRYHRYCSLPHTTCILVIVQNITTLQLLLCIWCIVSQLCVCRGSVIIELISRMNTQSAWMLGVLEIEESLFFGGSLVRNIYTRHHICSMRVKSRRVSLKRRFDVKICIYPSNIQRSTYVICTQQIISILTCR